MNQKKSLVFLISLTFAGPALAQDMEALWHQGSEARRAQVQDFKNLSPEEREERLNAKLAEKGITREEFEARKAERQALREEMKDLSPEERQVAMQEHFNGLSTERQQQIFDRAGVSSFEELQTKREEMRASGGGKGRRHFRRSN